MEKTSFIGKVLDAVCGMVGHDMSVCDGSFLEEVDEIGVEVDEKIREHFRRLAEEKAAKA